MKLSFKSMRGQRGAVLVISLIMLAVMTLFVISMLKTSIVELKIGGSSQVAALNFANAEVAINNFVSANYGRFAPDFLAIAAGPTAPINTPPVVYGGTVAVTARQVNCGPPPVMGNQMGSGSLSAVQFDILATATGALGGSARVHQGIQSFAAPGACP